MKELLKRVLTGIILIPLVFGVFYISGWPLLLFVILFLSAGMLEYLNLYRIQNYVSLLFLVSIITGFYVLSLSYFLLFIIGMLFLYLSLFLYRWDRGYTFEKFSGEFFILLYLIIGGLAIFLIRDLLGFKYVVLFFVSVWIYDTGAYIFGKAIGKHKLAYHISPGKTVEGVLFGFLTIFVLGILYRYLRPYDFAFSIRKYFTFSLLISLTSTVGDLVESIWKREQGVKDSSNIFPGHGGVLDRIDSLILTAPFFYLFFKFLS